MMKTGIVLLGLLFCWDQVFSQNLEGEWKGAFRDNTNGNLQEITFHFIKKSDSTYQAFSKTFLKTSKISDSAICVLNGGFKKKNILYLEETRALKKFSEDFTETCLQFMKLYYDKKKDKLILSGNWYTIENNCGYGTIRVTKSY